MLVNLPDASATYNRKAIYVNTPGAHHDGTLTVTEDQGTLRVFRTIYRLYRLEVQPREGATRVYFIVKDGHEGNDDVKAGAVGKASVSETYAVRLPAQGAPTCNCKAGACGRPCAHAQAIALLAKLDGFPTGTRDELAAAALAARLAYTSAYGVEDEFPDDPNF